MPGENNPNSNSQNQEQAQTAWDDLAQAVPFQEETAHDAVAESTNTSEKLQESAQTVGDILRNWYTEVDLTTGEFTERFRQSKIYEDATKYTAQKITDIQYIDDLHGDGQVKVMQVEGWVENPDELAYVQPYKRDESHEYPEEIAAIMAPSSDHQCKVVGAKPLYKLAGDAARYYTATPEEFAEQYAENEDGTYHNTELLRIVKAKPEEKLTMDKEQLEAADKEARQEGTLYALPMTEYFTAPVDLHDPNNVPTQGRRAEMSIRSGYGPIE